MHEICLRELQVLPCSLTAARCVVLYTTALQGITPQGRTTRSAGNVKQVKGLPWRVWLRRVLLRALPHSFWILHGVILDTLTGVVAHASLRCSRNASVCISAARTALEPFSNEAAAAQCLWLTAGWLLQLALLSGTAWQ